MSLYTDSQTLDYIASVHPLAHASTELVNCLLDANGTAHELRLCLGAIYAAWEMADEAIEQMVEDIQGDDR